MLDEIVELSILKSMSLSESNNHCFPIIVLDSIISLEFLYEHPLCVEEIDAYEKKPVKAQQKLGVLKEVQLHVAWRNPKKISILN